MNEGSLTTIKRCTSLDQTDLTLHDVNLYPESYQHFKKFIEHSFFKSEMLLNCKLEFEKIVNFEVGILEKLYEEEAFKDIMDLNLNLLFTGAIKSGRGSIINMILNTKVLPVNVLGNGCCIKISYPKNPTKHISVGMYDWDDWELDKPIDISIDELPTQIEEMQKKILSEKLLLGRNKKVDRRLHVQLPHWLLKNINIYKCSPIDGMYSFDEPFDIIKKKKNIILFHVIDASNGLMEWDRTFLSQIQYKVPDLPIFFIINHIDIQYETIMRDRCVRFECTPDKPISDILGSESDQTSADESIHEKFAYSDESIKKQQELLIENSKKQISKLGFALEKGLKIQCTNLSAKEFFNKIKNKEKLSSYYYEKLENFFQKLQKFIDAWMEKTFVASLLKIKCLVNGTVDSLLCHILYSDALSMDLNFSMHLQQFRKTEKSIDDNFTDVIREFENQVLKIVKEQLKNYEERILKSIPDLTAEDPAEIAHIIKPTLIKNCEKVLLKKPEFNINKKIEKILEEQITSLEKDFQKLYLMKNVKDFAKSISDLFRVLKKNFHIPMVVHLPDDIFNTNTKWYKELIRVAARRIRGANNKYQMGHQIIDDITIEPLIKVALINLRKIQNDIQYFTRKYQDIYKQAQVWPIGNMEKFQQFVKVEFIIQALERSFLKSQFNENVNQFQQLSSFHCEFYESKNVSDFIYKKVPIQNVKNLDVIINLCSKRILPPNNHIFSFKSTVLLSDDTCWISFPKAERDLHNAIKNKTPWTLEGVNSIMNNLISAVKFLLQFHRYIPIGLFPENIMLQPNPQDPYHCFLYPFDESKNSISYNSSADKWKQYDSITNKVIFQLGMVLSWIVTNDIHICADIYGKSLTSILEGIILGNIKSHMLEELKQSSLEETCSEFLFRSKNYGEIDSINRYFKKCQKAEPIINKRYPTIQA